MQINKLTINHKKTEFILITTKNINKFDIKINGITTKRINSSKYLGIIIDDKLNEKNHVQNLCSEISTGFWVIANIKHFGNCRVLLVLTRIRVS